jgi:hypothetical protein
MSIRKIIIGLFVCFSLMLFISRTLSQTSEMPEYPTDFGNEQQITSGETQERFAQRRAEMEERKAKRKAEMEERFAQQGADAEERRTQRIAEIEERMAQQKAEIEKREEEAMKQALGADERQWRIIKPKLEKVKEYKEQASICIGLPFSGNFTGNSQSFAGGYQYQFGFSSGAVGPMTSTFTQANSRESKGEKICRELLATLENPNSSAQEIERKVTALQEYRAEAAKQLIKAQRELREVLKLRQQARLVLMDLLD